ncbi:MAG TPA: Flp family type IVb pilin [Sphingomicrobium sp.]|nr:Flp family type IVb pilin [Sphingomicrobium sp.]
MNRNGKLLRDNAGATSIEYAAVASLISVVAISAFASVGNSVLALFATVPSF